MTSLYLLIKNLKFKSRKGQNVKCHLNVKAIEDMAENHAHQFNIAAWKREYDMPPMSPTIERWRPTQVSIPHRDVELVRMDLGHHFLNGSVASVVVLGAKQHNVLTELAED